MAGNEVEAAKVEGDVGENVIKESSESAPSSGKVSGQEHAHTDSIQAGDTSEEQELGQEKQLAQKASSQSLADLDREISGVAAEEFKPSKGIYIAFSTLSVITLMVALDGTSLSVALPVSSKGFALTLFLLKHNHHNAFVFHPQFNKQLTCCFLDRSVETPRYGHRGILVGDLVPSDLDRLSTYVCFSVRYLWTETSALCGPFPLPAGRNHCRCGS